MKTGIGAPVMILAHDEFRGRNVIKGELAIFTSKLDPNRCK
jgi:hypothetical protein